MNRSLLGSMLATQWYKLHLCRIQTHESTNHSESGLLTKVIISKKKRLHPDTPCAPCASGGPGAWNVNSLPRCAVFYWVLGDRGACRPDTPDATKDSEGTGRGKVLRTQKGSQYAERFSGRRMVLRTQNGSPDATR